MYLNLYCSFLVVFFSLPVWSCLVSCPSVVQSLFISARFSVTVHLAHVWPMPKFPVFS